MRRQSSGDGLHQVGDGADVSLPSSSISHHGVYPDCISEGHCLQLLTLLHEMLVVEVVHSVRTTESHKLCNLANMGSNSALLLAHREQAIRGRRQLMPIP